MARTNILNYLSPWPGTQAYIWLKRLTCFKITPCCHVSEFLWSAKNLFMFKFLRLLIMYLYFFQVQRLNFLKLVFFNNNNAKETRIHVGQRSWVLDDGMSTMFILFRHFRNFKYQLMINFSIFLFKESKLYPRNK